MQRNTPAEIGLSRRRVPSGGVATDNVECSMALPRFANHEEDIMTEQRPGVWVGHIVQEVSNIEAGATFYEDLGMRRVEVNENVAVLELRGGTHIVLLPADLGQDERTASFDLMVDDIDAAWTRWNEAGYPVSAIERGTIHDKFTLTDPDGTLIPVNSSHVIGVV